MTHRLATEPWDAISTLGRCSCATWSRIGSTSYLYRQHGVHVATERAGQEAML